MPIILMNIRGIEHHMVVPERAIDATLRVIRPDTFVILMDDKKKYMDNDTKARIMQRFTRRE